MKQEETNDKTDSLDWQAEVVKGGYVAPEVIAEFELEAMAVLCTDINAKNDVALGCNPGALFS